jgi:4-hydroxybenzoate polyprenyltransferase
VAALLLLSKFGSSTLAIAVAIAGLSALYSFPRVHLKGVPVLSSVLHFAGGLLHFLLGYSVFTAPDWRGIQIGSFFALVFVAGHLTHETRDSDSDRVNDIRTNAVTFGKMRSFIGGLILFTIADILLVVLALWSIVPRPLSVVVLILPLHVYWSLKTIQSGLTFASIERLQARYRALYAGMGLWMVATLLFGR